MKTIKNIWKTYRYDDLVRTYVNYCLYWSVIWTVVIMVIVFNK